MGYDWDSHKEICYRLYILEGWSLERIMIYMKSVFDFTPRRAFQIQFRRWNFPLKSKTHDHDGQLLGRIKELWEKNFTQGEMMRALEEDGFDVAPHEVMKLRVKNRWLMRGPNQDKPKTGTDATVDPSDEFELLEHLDPSALLHENTTLSPSHEGDGEGKRKGEGGNEEMSASHQSLSAPSPELSQGGDANTIAPAEKHNDTNKKKRNRFKRDASGAIIRFPSEMTIDDARRKLGLDQPTYRLLRAHFQKICTTLDVSKKSAGSEKWEAAKTRLLHELPELYHKLWTPEDELETKQVALDAICRDTAKRMRLMDSRMTQAEVKNALGINPQQARDIRLIFNRVLIQAGFANKPDSTPTPQQWDNLRRLWGKHSDVIEKILADISGDPSDHLKARALDVLSRDILKRLRDNRAGRDLKRQQRLDQVRSDTNQSTTDGLGTRNSDMNPLLDSRPSADQIDLGDGLSTSTLDDVSEASYTPQTMLSPASGSITPFLPLSLQSPGVVGVSLDARDDALRPRPQPAPIPSQRMFSSEVAAVAAVASNVHLDSTVGQSLLLAANTDTNFLDGPYVTQPYGPTQSSAQMFHHGPPISAVFAVYFRMHPSSTFIAGEPLWIATMSSKSVQELRQVATDKLPEVACLRIEGIVKDRSGRELPLVIENDEQLAAYFSYVLGETPTFSVQLVWK
ncbi:hypothetical protein V8C37DRAFT_297637 [Trichoderma ceciliae]